LLQAQHQAPRLSILIRQWFVLGFLSIVGVPEDHQLHCVSLFVPWGVSLQCDRLGTSCCADVRLRRHLWHCLGIAAAKTKNSASRDCPQVQSAQPVTAILASTQPLPPMSMRYLFIVADCAQKNPTMQAQTILRMLGLHLRSSLNSLIKETSMPSHCSNQCDHPESGKGQETKMAAADMQAITLPQLRPVRTVSWLYCLLSVFPGLALTAAKCCPDISTLGV